MINLGEIAVTDGHLDIQLGKGLDGYWTVIGRVVITPITPEGVASPDAATEGNQSFESIQEGSDTLKSIGYL